MAFRFYRSPPNRCCGLVRDIFPKLSVRWLNLKIRHDSLATSHQSCRASSPCPKDHLDLLTSQTSTRFWQTFSARVYLENQSPNFAAGASPLLMDTAMQRPGMQQRERLRLDCKGSVRVGVATNFQNIWGVHWVSQWLWIQPQRRSTATVV